MGHDISFSQDDARQFAAWSGDRNPLHVDLAAARRSVFGRPVVHGVLTTIRALGSAPHGAPEPIRTLAVEFRHAVHPGTALDIEPLTSNTGTVFALRNGADAALIVRINETPPATPSTAWVPPALKHTAPLRSAPASPSIESLQAGHELCARHSTGAVPAEYLAGGRLHPIQARVLALCSYVIGMEMPGLRSLFTRLQLDFSTDLHDSPDLVYRARAIRFDPHFRLLDVQIDVASPDGTHVASGELRAYVRFTPVETDPAVFGSLLSPGARSLTGRIALVTGGTRGLGAEITAALAMGGCRVYAGYRSDSAAAGELARTLHDAPGHVEFVAGDAADRSWCESTITDILRRDGRLDLLVLNACAPPANLRLGAETADAFGAYIASNLPLAQVPLATCLPALTASHGTVVGISSSFVADPPAGFGHYVALKEAVESTIRTAAREYPGVRALLARPPRLQTAWNDTPTGVLGTIAARDAAAHIVNAVADTGRASIAVLNEFPALQTPRARAARVDSSAAAPEFFLALAASFTADPLVPALEFWFRELGVRGEVEVAPYGQVLQTLLSPAGGLSGRPAAHVVLLRLRDWLRELRPEDATSPAFLHAYLDATTQDFERAMRTHRAQARGETLLIFCPSALHAPDVAEPLLARAEEELRARLIGLPGLTTIRARDFHETYGVTDESVGDPVREHIAHIPYQTRYLHTLGTIVMRQVHRRLVPPRKLVAVDCDNTLWSGVVGEVGAEGLRFDDGHRALHDALARLAASGVLVALCSKNEEADVWRVFDTRSDLGLGRDAIVTAAINWQPKSANLRAMAERLNLGLDSFIFIDDNPVECAEVRAACPQVLTLEWPQDAVQAIALLRHTWELDARDATGEDRRRTELYKEEFRRQELQNQALTFRDFIATLDLAVDIAPLSQADVKRASQLTLRTNQFNFTTRRRDEADLQSLLAAGTHDISTVRVRDRFGDYGLVGLLIAEASGTEVLADTFLLSCRVLGRGVEHRMVAELGRAAAAREASLVRLRVDPTQRNTPARNFLQSIASSGQLRHEGAALELDIPVQTACAITFEPPEQAPAAVVDNERTTRTQAGTDAFAIRTREAQIKRAAFELSTAHALAAAVGGGPSAAAPSVGLTFDTSFVYQTFSSALGISADEVRRVDSLEALGCDSFKIVEITVSLLERYPQLPGTLLFEHRTVSAIAGHIERLSTAAETPARTPATLAIAPRSSASADIAVVGMHLRCAGAQSPDELWTLLENATVAVAPVPRDRPYFFGTLEDTRPHFAGLLDGIDRFDAELFGITPREAEVMDPQLRLFLEVAWSALEDAGCLGEELDPDTGVFAGVMYGDYASRANVVAKEADNPFKCWEGFSLANRLSQVFGFRGPSLAIDTACSSSGTAVHLACRALNAGDCRVAIVGGVNLILDPDRFVQLGRLGILSMSGRCLAFGADADGTVLGEGAGVVVLRRVEDAVERGDRIYGVIKATGVSTGSGTVGFTAPNPVAQAEAIRRTVMNAGIDPRTISYVETHGTGTALGDPIEVRGLMLAYGDEALFDSGIEIAHRCSIGSIKPNIGHLEAGAGVMGLIKLLLQLQRRKLLPSVTSAEANPQIPFSDTPFSVQRALEPWQQPVARVNGTSTQVPRRGALNSFGVGGANAHIIAEEPPQSIVRRADVERPLHVLAVSARSDDGLRQRFQDLARLLSTRADVALADLCFSTNTGQRHLPRRAAVIAGTREEMVRSLEELADGGEPDGAVQSAVPRAGSAPQVAFLFTGQGSQTPGMGRSLYETQPVFKAALDRCFELFAPLLPAGNLEACMFAEGGTPLGALLNQTGFTQPALFSFGYALSELWKSWGITPAVVMGHSIGEITAMCIAGGMSLEDGVALVAARGNLMQALPAGGAMTSVMASEGQVRAALAGFEDRVSLAAVNAPSQIVISGEAAAVEAVASRLAADGVKTRSLVVSHAFHSPLMHPMLEEYERVLRRVRFTPPRTAFVSTVFGRVVEQEVLQPEYWLRNVTDPVRFTDGIGAMESTGARAFVEMGPQPVLLGLARQCLAATDVEERLWLASARKEGSSWSALLASLSQLYLAGAAVDWRAFDAPYGRRRVSLPPYPFKGRRHWITPSPSASAPAGDSPSRSASTAEFAPMYEIAWRHTDPSVQPATSVAGTWIIFDDDIGTGVAVLRELRKSGANGTVIPHDPNRSVDAARTLRAAGSLRGIVYLPASAAGANDLPAVAATRVEEAFEIMRAAASLEGSPGPALWIVTRDAVAPTADADGRIDAVHGALWGGGRTFALEHPRRWGALVDVPSSTDREIAASVIARELGSGGSEDQVAIRSTGRFVPRLVRRSDVRDDSPAVARDGAYLVTGGLGALGLHAAQWLVSRGARHLVLAGRRGTASPGAAEAVRDLQRSGAAVTVVAADISTSAGIDVLLGAVPSNAPLAGIIHAAGIDDTRPILDMEPGDATRVMTGKVAGAWWLHERTRDLPIQTFVCFSSIASVLGSAGRAAYASANAFLDALARERHRLQLPALSINWGPWAGGGMATAAALEQYRRAGNIGLDAPRALRSMEALISSGAAQGMVANIDWETFRIPYEAAGAKPIISELRGTHPDTVTSDEPLRRAPWIDRLETVPPDRRLAELTSLLQQEVALTLGLEGAGEVPPDRVLREMGMDSLMSADFAQRLRKRLGIKSTALVFEHPTVARLAAHLVEKLAVPALVSVGVPEVAVAAASIGYGSERAFVTAAAPAISQRGGPADEGGPSEGYRWETEAEVFEFQKTAYPKRSADLIPARWRWMFVESARRLDLAPQVWLHRQDGRIVGHNGAIPVRVKIGAAERSTAWLVDTMVLPEYRSQAVGAQLMIQSHEDLPFALSLGQTQQMREILLRLDWQQVAPLETAQLLIRPERVLKGKLPSPAALAAGVALRAGGVLRGVIKGRGNATVREITRFDASHDLLWERLASEVTCAVRRDASYLNWKYVDQPGQEFLRLEVSDGQDARGVVVLMFRDPDVAYRYRRAFIVDVIAPLGNDTLMAELLSSAVRAAADRSADALLCLHINAKLTAALQRQGFRLRSPSRYLLVRPVGLDDQLRDRLLDPAAWFVTQGDSDIDRP